VEKKPNPLRQGIPEQLIQIAQEQEGGAERVISQIEVVQSSFEEIQVITKECQELLARLMPPSEELNNLIAKMEQVALHADNGLYNVSGVFDLFQYQDIFRQKLERVGRRLIDVSAYILANLSPQEDITKLPSDATLFDQSKGEADAVVAEFFAKQKSQKSSE